MLRGWTNRSALHIFDMGDQLPHIFKRKLTLIGLWSDVGTGDFGVLTTHEASLIEITTTGRPHQATASPGSDALAPPSSVGQVSNRQTETLLCRKDDLRVAYWKVRTLQYVGVQTLKKRELR